MHVMCLLPTGAGRVQSVVGAADAASAPTTPPYVVSVTADAVTLFAHTGPRYKPKAAWDTPPARLLLAAAVPTRAALAALTEGGDLVVVSLPKMTVAAQCPVGLEAGFRAARTLSLAGGTLLRARRNNALWLDTVEWPDAAPPPSPPPPAVPLTGAAAASAAALEASAAVDW